MKSVITLCIALCIVTLAVFWQVGDHGFQNLDDNMFVTANTHVLSGLKAENLVWAFTPTPGVGWHPVTWLSHMTDVEFFGVNPRGHHLTSLAFHTAAALILFLFLHRLTHTLWRSVLVAALFALHPLHVESVAWVAERRDVLSAFFGFLCLWLYAESVMRQSRRLYLIALLCFILGLMSKPILITLPIILLLLDFWPLNRLHFTESLQQPIRWPFLGRETFERIKEKTPFFVCSMISAIITLSSPIKIPEQFFASPSLWLRIVNAPIAYATYLIKTFWPTGLAVYYPLPATIPPWQIICSLLLLITVTTGVIRTAKRYPYLVVGWFWFVITLIPVLGIIRFGNHAWADRYTYLSLIGIFIMTVWGISDLTRSLSRQKIVLATLATVTIALTSIATWQQLSYWKTPVALLQHTVQVTHNNVVSRNNLGCALMEAGQFSAAAEEFAKALAIVPNSFKLHFNYGLTLMETMRFDEAITALRQSIALKDDFSETHNKLGLALAQTGRILEATEEFRRAVNIDPANYFARNNYGLALTKTGRLDEGIAELTQAVRLKPDFFNSHFNLGMALIDKGMLNDAIAELKQALEIEPRSLETQEALQFAVNAAR